MNAKSHARCKSAPSMPKRILVIDDHGLIRLALREALREEFGRVEIGEAGDAQSGLEHVLHEPWDLVVLDLNLPDRSGYDLMEETRHNKPNQRFLVISGYAMSEVAPRLLEAGARGYVSKVSPIQEFIRAVHEVLEGHRYLLGLEPK